MYNVYIQLEYLQYLVHIDRVDLSYLVQFIC